MSPTDQEPVRRILASESASREEALAAEPHRSRDEDNNVLASRAEERVAEPVGPLQSRVHGPRQSSSQENNNVHVCVAAPE